MLRSVFGLYYLPANRQPEERVAEKQSEDETDYKQHDQYTFLRDTFSTAITRTSHAFAYAAVSRP